ncbi:MAG: hypothetical protein KDB69_08975 [Acidimicrobiia bacterium]|nr:hypothetical protein [Acidimicrobiia bacterium]
MTRRRVVRRLAAAWRQGRGGERGAVLILAAALLTVFMGMAGFAIDLGWLFWNGIRIQHGADAAALAGVIYEPSDQTNAFGQAVESARENGYYVSFGSVVVPEDAKTNPAAVDNEQQLRVTITHPVDTFFMRVFGLSTVTVTKTAVAEYVTPLPLGSPEPQFGNDPTTGYDPGFWGNIHGYYTGRSMGDRYASQCIHNNSGSSCTANPDRRPTTYSTPSIGSTSNAAGGYVYGLEVRTGGVVTLQVFDGQFTRGGGDHVLVGDNPQGSSPGPTTVFILYDTDPTPLDTSDNTVLCYSEFEPRDALMPTANSSTTFADYDAYLNANGPIADPKGDISDLDDLWDPVCTQALSPGIYPVRVLMKETNERGLNRWSMKATGGSARIYGLGDMAIYSNVDGASGNTVFYLSEVAPIHAGKDLVIELWDPGDASGNHSMRVLPPPTVNGGAPLPCVWTSTDGTYPGGSEASCDIPTSGGRFNDDLVTVRIPIPETYTCTEGTVPGCWWRIEYNYPGTTQDTTTWSARIEGNPVKIVE